ncbi:hypothetical protein [Asticcacaulis excentricus]|uniref:Uncharacterized protein n=1 Tax=Asticcacaulis excentricus (strain ATCC 15261 / DSM 4724 / KCTC 12464 / NCIMB 9791 / VKM B-1370 / CB 48) TaxID=573065 RepID=E8RRV0_ASTEC|nr:hypothetical protein [Asticcacaulis excentricus]ADU13475.1 hypothetical protein Astex_1811 [Asticcacaulis excentricus CB 48]
MTDATVATQLIEHAGVVILATGAVGTAASALVDASRGIFPGYGVSSYGYKHIKAVYEALEPALSVALGRSWEPVLRGYWLNGTPHEQQINTVIAMVRLGLNDDNPQALLDRLLNTNAPGVKLAAGSETGGTPVEVASLKDAVRLIKNPPVPPPPEADDPMALAATEPEVSRAEALRTQQAFDALGRFDALVRARLDAAFELADHDYRAKARLSAAVVSLGLALACGAAFAYADGSVDDTAVFAGAAILGLLAVPLAPIAKDLTSALRAASDALKTVTNKG